MSFSIVISTQLMLYDAVNLSLPQKSVNMEMHVSNIWLHCFGGKRTVLGENQNIRGEVEAFSSKKKAC